MGCRKHLLWDGITFLGFQFLRAESCMVLSPCEPPTDRLLAVRSSPLQKVFFQSLSEA